MKVELEDFAEARIQLLELYEDKLDSAPTSLMHSSTIELIVKASYDKVTLKEWLDCLPKELLENGYLPVLREVAKSVKESRSGWLDLCTIS